MRKFKSKSLIRRDYVSLLKGMTLFFLGASVVILATYAVSIDPGINNAVQYIQKIVVTDNGTADGNTGIILDGNGSMEVNGILSAKGGLYMNESQDILFFSNSYMGLGRYINWGGFNGGQALALWGQEGGYLGTQNDSGQIMALYWNDDGNVGIGTDSPGGNKLKVMGSTYIDGGNLFVKNNGYYNDAIIGLSNNITSWDFVAIGNNLNIGKTVIGYGTPNNGNINIINGSIPTITITSGGNVGIGTDNPQAKLQVKGDVLIGTGTATATLDINRTEGRYSGNLLRVGYEGTDRFRVHAGGDAYLDGWFGIGIDSINNNSNGHSLLVGGTSYLAGNVGIKTNDPQASLHVKNGAIMENGGFSFFPNGGVGFQKKGEINYFEVGGIGGLVIYGNTTTNGGHDGNILLNPYTWASSGGNVGIAKDNPQAKLDVGGGIRFKVTTDPDTTACDINNEGELRYYSSALYLCVYISQAGSYMWVNP